MKGHENFHLFTFQMQLQAKPSSLGPWVPLSPQLLIQTFCFPFMIVNLVFFEFFMCLKEESSWAPYCRVSQVDQDVSKWYLNLSIVGLNTRKTSPVRRESRCRPPKLIWFCRSHTRDCGVPSTWKTGWWMWMVQQPRFAQVSFAPDCSSHQGWDLGATLHPHLPIGTCEKNWLFLHM